MSDDPKVTLDRLQQRLDSANATYERTKGRLESAKSTLEDVRKECQDKKIDPDKIDGVIDALSGRYTTKLAEFEADVSRAEKDLSPFLGEVQ